MERGILVHAALAAFWRETRDHAALVALAADAGPYADARERAARAAMAEIDDARWRRVPAAVRALEAGRLARLLGAWLDAVELPRSPFTVVHVEHEERLVLGALELELRLDRLDELADGGAAIVDYKTGKVSSPARWIADRPEATQLALYTLARRAAPSASPGCGRSCWGRCARETARRSGSTRTRRPDGERRRCETRVLASSTGRPTRRDGAR